MNTRSEKVRVMWAAVAVMAVAVGAVAGVLGSAWLATPVDVPRPGAPRATAEWPCVDCRVAPPVNSVGVVITAGVTDSVRRPFLQPCPAGFRAKGKRGDGGVCPSETSFRVAMELLPGAHQLPDRAAIAHCPAGGGGDFDIVAERGVYSAHSGQDARSPRPNEERRSNCDEVRSTQPELRAVAFDVHQLFWLQRYQSETVDTASQRVVEPMRTIGYLKTATLDVVGVRSDA
ncbi:hypothetical protein [Tsukamurella pulmonis]|nr:hypothetical protein [Tsukamurella pulmonis]